MRTSDLTMRTCNEGAVHTPQILELSGIGDKTLLNSLSIPVKVDLPGVGENLHVCVYHWHANDCTNETSKLGSLRCYSYLRNSEQLDESRRAG